SRTALLATTALGGLRTAAMFFLTNPIGIAITAVAAALALVALNAERATPATRELDGATSDLADATSAYESAALAAATATGEAKKTALEEARALRVVQEEKRRAAQRSLELARALLAQAQ